MEASSLRSVPCPSVSVESYTAPAIRGCQTDVLGWPYGPLVGLKMVQRLKLYGFSM